MPANSSVGLRAFGKAMFAHWGTAMSGPLSVPAAVAAVFVTNNTAQIFLGLTAFVCVWVAAYGIWKAEREKNKTTDPADLMDFVKSRQNFSIAEAACLLARSEIVLDDLRGLPAGYLHDIRREIIRGKIDPVDVSKIELMFARGNALGAERKEIPPSWEITKADLVQLAKARSIQIPGLT